MGDELAIKDGQEAGEMLLDIEARIGELAYEEERAPAPSGKGGRFQPSGKPEKHERIGISRTRMGQSQAISKYPEIVERVKAQARENEDIPTYGRNMIDAEAKSKARENEAKIENLLFVIWVG